MKLLDPNPLKFACTIYMHDLLKWGVNAPKVTIADLQQTKHEIIEMNISTQRHDILYISKEISHMYQEI